MLTTLDRRQTRRQATDAEFPRYVSMYDVNEILVHLEGDEQRLFHEEKNTRARTLDVTSRKIVHVSKIAIEHEETICSRVY